MRRNNQESYTQKTIKRQKNKRANCYFTIFSVNAVGKRCKIETLLWRRKKIEKQTKNQTHTDASSAHEMLESKSIFSRGSNVVKRRNKRINVFRSVVEKYLTRASRKSLIRSARKTLRMLWSVEQPRCVFVLSILTRNRSKLTKNKNFLSRPIIDVTRTRKFS